MYLVIIVWMRLEPLGSSRTAEEDVDVQKTKGKVSRRQPAYLTEYYRSRIVSSSDEQVMPENQRERFEMSRKTELVNFRSTRAFNLQGMT